MGLQPERRTERQQQQRRQRAERGAELRRLEGVAAVPTRAPLGADDGAVAYERGQASERVL